MKKRGYERAGSHWTATEILNLRKDLGMTRTELASRLGVCERTVIRWEQGDTTPIRIFDRTFDELCAGIIIKKESAI